MSGIVFEGGSPGAAGGNRCAALCGSCPLCSVHLPAAAVCNSDLIWFRSFEVSGPDQDPHRACKRWEFNGKQTLNSLLLSSFKVESFSCLSWSNISPWAPPSHRMPWRTREELSNFQQRTRRCPRVVHGYGAHVDLLGRFI